MLRTKYLIIAAWATLLAGFAAYVVASSPGFILMGKLAIVVAILGLAATLIGYLMRQASMALGLREEDFHWH